MARKSPLLSRHLQAEALLDTYGPPEAGVRVVQTFGEPDLEYAAIRRGCGLIDQPQRGTIEIFGRDRVEFLNRMLTQELKGFSDWRVVRSFWLSRKGRIDADVRLICTPDRIWMDLDVHAVERTVSGLTAFVIAEDCAIVDRTGDTHRLALHGPTAAAALAQACATQAGGEIAALRPGRAATGTIGAAEIVIDRDDSTGAPGFELLVPVGAVPAVWDRFLELAGPALDPAGLSSPPFHLRPIGWAAYNIARLEAGFPIYYLDFGPDSLPHETGVLDSRVSFTKGCYLGQEIVARMQSLGKPKQQLVALRLVAPPMTTGADPTLEADLPDHLQPVTGAGVFLRPSIGTGADPRPADCGDPIGAVTSSCISPLLSSTPLCLAMLKSAHAVAGTPVLVDCDGGLVPATVQPALRSIGA